VDREGREEFLDLEPQDYIDVEISPDGKHIALRIRDTDSSDLWIYDIERGIKNVITTTGRAMDPLWTPEGERLIYNTIGGGLLSIAADGSDRPRRLTESQDASHRAMTWSADGQLIYVDSLSTYRLSMEDGQVAPVYVSDEWVGSSRISPDGRWMAYHSFKSNRWEVYVRPYPDMGEGEWRISTDGGGNPRWRADSKMIFYKDEVNNQILSVSIDTVPEFSPGAPQVMVKGVDYNWRQSWKPYDVHPDGEKLLMRKYVENTDTGPVFTSLVHVENWFEELKRLAPPDPQ